MPPEAKDVPELMSDMMAWIKDSEVQGLPCPIRAGIAHYQFATIHPYYDGNGRTARLLTTLILHLGRYDLKGLYSLEEYYARNLAPTTRRSPSVPRTITTWAEPKRTLPNGWNISVKARRTASKMSASVPQEAAGPSVEDSSPWLRKLDPRQRKALVLFRHSDAVTSRDIAKLFTLSERAARNLVTAWVEQGFVLVADPAKKSRKYGLANEFRRLLR